jgi:hypothetical protein
MLLVHEVHEVAGRSSDAFEAVYRDGWLPRLAESDGARLLWFLHQTHGTGPAYTVVTVTAVASLAAWEALNERVRRGDLRSLAADIDAMRHGSIAKVLEPLAFSPMLDVDLPSVPTATAGDDRGDHVLFMEDTAWPHRGRYEDYLERAGTLYVETLRRANEHGRAILELVGAFTPAYGTGHHREIVLWQRVAKPELLLPLLTREVPAIHRAPGTWMHEALDVRDRWESRLLRCASWSPLQ